MTYLEPEIVVPPVRPRRRPIFSWIAFALIVLAALALGGAVAYGYQQTQDAFVPGPPWFSVTASVGIIPVVALSFLALVFAIVALARREKPGWPAVLALVLAFPGFGYAAYAGWVLLTVTVACAGPAGACR